MIYKTPIFTLTALCLSLWSAMAFSGQTYDKGYRLPNEAVSGNYILMKLYPEHNSIAKHIYTTNYRVERSDALQMAKNIFKVAYCFKVDPWILTALIQKESTFQVDAVSSTNAAGLTQFTSSGFREVNDQLGIRGVKGATESAIVHFSSKVRECIDPNWIDLWEKVGVAHDNPDFFNLLKEQVKTDSLIAITYGAILLKTYLAYVTNKNKDAETPLSKSEVYFMALQIYNGEEGEAKVNYAKSVFKNLQKMYPAKTNFPFLQD